jgi:hypothetical protein
MISSVCPKDNYLVNPNRNVSGQIHTTEKNFSQLKLVNERRNPQD